MTADHAGQTGGERDPLFMLTRRQVPPPPTGQQMLDQMAELVRQHTVHVVVHPDDYDRVATAMEREPALTEVHQSTAVDPGKALTWTGALSAAPGQEQP